MITKKQMGVATTVVAYIDLVLGVFVCKSNMNPIIKTFIMATLINDSARVVNGAMALYDAFNLYRDWHAAGLFIFCS